SSGMERGDSYAQLGRRTRIAVGLLCALASTACGSNDAAHSDTDGGASGGSDSGGVAGRGATASDGGQSTATGGFGGSRVTEFDAGCQHDVSLTAVTLGTPQPFDLVIVADNSDSLSFSREDLSAGVRDLLTNVRGRDVRVFLLTSTQ